MYWTERKFNNTKSLDYVVILQVRLSTTDYDKEKNRGLYNRIDGVWSFQMHRDNESKYQKFGIELSERKKETLLKTNLNF